MVLLDRKYEKVIPSIAEQDHCCLSQLNLPLSHEICWGTGEEGKRDRLWETGLTCWLLWSEEWGHGSSSQVRDSAGSYQRVSKSVKRSVDISENWVNFIQMLLIVWRGNLIILRGNKLSMTFQEWHIPKIILLICCKVRQDPGNKIKILV